MANYACRKLLQGSRYNVTIAFDLKQNPPRPLDTFPKKRSQCGPASDFEAESIAPKVGELQQSW